MDEARLVEQAARHAALGDPVRLAVVEQLVVSDRSPQELQRRLGVASNLLTHHLDVLEGAGLVVRGRSIGDGRRRYVHLLPVARELAVGRGGRAHGVVLPGVALPSAALFVCTANSARSQIAAALWRSMVGAPASSAGTDPARRVHPGAVAAARRAGLDLSRAEPRRLVEVDEPSGLVVAVCDRAHEALPGGDGRLHWSIPDPAVAGTRAAFDRTVGQLRDWIAAVAA